ncbi:hypothetical protein DM01DRAFT_1330046 [Hesseltinella vesiculosa]|uniref:Sodium/calcium exchanger membrane region domain-containing protein n=1 Tax=Hesseltinella vesiculosa TaxID=101127 RepID=A0A1X2G296_9FUNG|nr:hypothetical protein DM01DRAFT_1330046 [Hesseltinella vesiculosa]
MKRIYRSVVYGLIFLIAFYTIHLFTSNSHTVSLLVNTESCNNINQQSDQCSYVQSSCTGFLGLYLEFYYCTPFWRPGLLGSLICVLLLLFGAIGVVASDFFCPNLQTIAAKLNLSESLAGVTVLAFGNGSPDLFGTFSAMQHGSGSMAIGEIIGAAFFVVSIIAGSMGIIRPFQSKRITFMRDATFLTGAISLLTWIIYHGKIYWYHGLALIGYYLFYVITVLISSYDWPFAQKVNEEMMFSPLPNMDETAKLLDPRDKGMIKPLRLDIPVHGFSTSHSEYEPHIGHIIRPTSPLSSRPSLHIETSLPCSTRTSMQLPRTTSTNGSISTLRPYRRAMTPRVGIRTSLFSAIELQSQVSAIRRANSSQQVQTPTLSPPPDHDMYSQHRRRQVSMPQDMWDRHQHIRTALEPLSQEQGRLRSVTMTDQRHLQPASAYTTQEARRSVTPDSTHSSTGVAEDYFAYLSTHQPQTMTVPQAPPPLPIPVIDIQQEEQQNPPIPEIRLAPPMLDQFHTPQNNTLSPLQPGTSLHVISPSPSFASSTDYDCFVSARQSPELSPARIPSLVIPQLEVASAQKHDSPHLDDHPKLSSRESSFIHDLKPQPPAPPAITALPQWQLVLRQVSQVLFPTLQEWSDKSWLSRLSSVIAVPLVFVFVITLPVAEAENTKIDDVKVVVNDNSFADDDDDDEAMLDSQPPPTSAFTTHTKYLSFSSIHGQLLPPIEPPIMSTQDSISPIANNNNSFLTVPRSESDMYLNQQHQSLPMLNSVTDIEVLEEDLRQGWCRWLLALQCFGSSFFLCYVGIMNEFLEWYDLGFCVCIGTALSYLVIRFTSSSEPPSWFWALSFAGFVVALNWIFLLADAMVGLLQAFGKIFEVSEAIMGLTVFAFGNSVGDLVSNTAIAKMGFPTMAISACYAGPLLNMVLGVGVSSTFQIWKAHGQPYQLVIPPTILVSAGGLLVVLLSTLFVVNMNGFYVNKKLGYWTMSVYVFCCMTNLLLEFGSLY